VDGDLSTTLPLSTLVNLRHQQPDPSNLPPRGTGLWVGPFQGIRRGQGTHFDDLRSYVAGDEVRHIDWKVSARRNHLHTRLYREEKEHVMTFVVDFRNVMFSGSTELLSVTSGRLLAALLWHAIDVGSRVSLTVLTDKGIQSTQAASGHSSAIAACGLLASNFAAARSASRTTHILSDDNKAHLEAKHSTLTSVLDELLALGRRAGTIVLASNFVDTDADFVKNLNMLSLSRPMVGLHIEDALCFDGIPAGHYRFIASRNGKALPRSTHLRVRDQARLIKKLDRKRDIIIEQFRSAKVTLIDGRIGLEPIKAELRHLGFLA